MLAGHRKPLHGEGTHVLGQAVVSNAAAFGGKMCGGSGEVYIVA